jgi:hypothetical protein
MLGGSSLALAYATLTDGEFNLAFRKRQAGTLAEAVRAKTTALRFRLPR